MDTTVAMFLIAGGAVALLIVLYASIADKWYKLRDDRDALSEQHQRLEVLYDRQRDMITTLQRQVVELQKQVKPVKATTSKPKARTTTRKPKVQR